MLLVVIAGVAAALGARTSTENQTSSDSIPLVEALRRQLMEDNYDYLPESSADGAPAPHRGGRGFAPRAREQASHSDEHAVSHNDLLYYVNDDTLGGGGDSVGNDVDDYSQVPHDDRVNTTEIKYTALKAKPAAWSRRSLSPRRFVQEEAAGAVAVIRLDDGPFPEFRLPRARRQYMRDEGGGP